MWHIRRPTGDFEDEFVEQFGQLSKRKQELEYIEQATNGDIDRVSAILKNFPDLDKDCVDEKGRTALRLAIRRQQTSVVEMLLDLSSGENIYNALLLSIDQDNDDVSEIIINHAIYRNYSKEKQKEIEKGIQSDAKEDETLFSQDVTPLMLAAHKEQTSIVQLLLELDERIEEPHKYDCLCSECQVVDTGESLKTARARLNAYRGLCSKAYILRTSKDPILRAFALCDKIHWLATQEKHFKKEYSQLKEQLGELVTKLMDRVRTEEELDVLLHEVAGASQEDMDLEEGAASKEFTRLNLALYREQKTFVSHPYCQRKLMSLWYGEQTLQQKGQSLPETLLKSFYLMLLYPVLAVIYWLMPDSKIGKQISAPIIKFSATVFTYLIFVCLIVAYSVIKTPTAGVNLSEHPTIGPHYREYAGISATNEVGKLRHFQSRELQSMEIVEVSEDDLNIEFSVTGFENTTDYSSTTGPPELTTDEGNYTDPEILPDIMIRYHSVDGVSVVICIWVIGYLVHDLKEVYSEPLGYYLASNFNIMDICLLTFYITSFTLRFVTIGKVQSAVNYLSRPEAWQSLRISGLDVRILNEDEALSHLYWINADRFYWDTFDPYVFCEALFATANILIICRLAGHLIVNEAMGPLVISLGRMIDDIVRFMILFGLVFFAYIIGFLNLYWYYFPDTRREAEVTDHQLEVLAGDAFGESALFKDYIYNNLSPSHVSSNFIICKVDYGMVNYFYVFPGIDIEETFTTAFWSLFGMVDPDSVEIDEGYAISVVTNRFGYILFGVYNVMAVVVFINVLIAMMSSSFEHVLESEDMEWKFARTNLYIDFLREGNVLPVPLNLIPTPKAIYHFFRYTLCKACCGSPKPKTEESPDGIELQPESVPTTSQNVCETPPNSESGISSEQGEGTSSHGSLDNPKMADIQYTKEVEEEEEGDMVSVYSSPVDTEELWKVRGQLKPEPEPCAAYRQVMGKLVHRYFNLGQSAVETGEQDDGAANTDKLKNELDGLRNELRMTTFRLKKDLNRLQQDTKSQIAKVEKQCNDVSEQCTGVSKQCDAVNVQCENIAKALNQLFSEMGNVQKGIADLKIIASKPIFLPQFTVSKESEESSPYRKATPVQSKIRAPEEYADPSSQTHTKKVPPSSLGEASKPSTSTAVSPKTSTLELPMEDMIGTSGPKQISVQQESLMGTLPKALSSLFGGIGKAGPSVNEDKLQKTDAQPQQAAMPPKVTSHVSDPSIKNPTKTPKIKSTPKSNKNKLITGPMIEYTIQPPIQQFTLLQGHIPEKLSQFTESSKHQSSDSSIRD